MLNTLISVLWFLLIFLIVVVSHEFGHFIIARANGIHVAEFFVGFGPTLIHWTIGGTKYSIKLLPLGGACVFDVEDDLEDAITRRGEKISEKSGYVSETGNSTAEEISGAESKDINRDAKEAADDHKYGMPYLEASVWKRLAVTVAGPLFNIILGFIISFILVNLIAIRDPVATDVIDGGAAQAAGILPGDRIISLNGQKICLYEDIMLFNALFNGGDVLTVYERDGVRGSVVITPQYNEEEGRYLLGISNADFVELHGADAFKYAWYEMRYNLKATYGSLFMLIRGRVKTKDVSGPVGIAVNVVGKTYEETKQYGFSTVLVNMMNIALMLTVNLGILNLLPIPALDGGKLIFLLIEIIRGKPVPRDKEAIVNFIGVIFFIVLMVLVFFNDIRNIFF
ncbi:MAG: site-2 protease family protein [Lachnospiraceae bacterium]|nr:site-2 protease family protein [Lachnospiraceae bacterium]